MTEEKIKVDLFKFSEDLSQELHNILTYWKNNALDLEHGGFVGKVDFENKVVDKSPKGIILNTRILWTFAKANNYYNDLKYDDECARAFNYLYSNFRDFKSGGVFWEVDYLGNPTNERKQIYAQAFCIYALSEYVKYSKNPKALLWAQEIFHLIEERAFDSEYGGYIEAFDREWKPIEDMRLSEKDLNAPKTTNTLLHILEAYTTLFEITQDQKVESALENLIKLFLNRIFSYKNHLKLFFTRDWKKLSEEISYGHDIETAWLILKAANVIGDANLIEKSEALMKTVTSTFVAEALDSDFGVFNSKDSITKHIDTDKHWWPQAEAMVGLIYTWKLTKESNYVNISRQIWNFIEENIIDHKNGEWFFSVDKDGVPYTDEDKIGPWKCPYHNTRACIEILDLINP